MKRLTMLVVVLMAGCATPEEFISRPADATIKLSGTTQTAALCLTRNLENHAGDMIVTQRPTPDGHEVIARLTGESTTTYAITDVRKTDAGTTATIWVADQISTSTENVVKAIVKGC